ncbi:hypothetical protein M758_6G113800 [Ceratodon purpureus]|nr:hypothetical protein M758_6G113800 [Ceratodon purpureus]
MQRVTSSRQRLLPEDLLQRYPMDNCIWTPQSRKERCIKNKGIKSKDDVAIPLRPISLLQNVERFRSKSVELKKPRFRTETTCGKGEEMPKDSAKKMLKVLPVIALDCDKNKSMWNCKANKKEWNAKHQGCCSQHWVSLLNKNEKNSLKKEQKIPRKVYFSPSSKSKFAEIAMQKTQIQSERSCQHLARSSNLSSSLLLSHEAVVDDMNQRQSASSTKRSNDATLNANISVSNDPCLIIPPSSKLKNPGFNSSAWVLAKMEALKNETFTESKALQIAKEYGIVLDEDDEIALKKFFDLEQTSNGKCQKDKTSEKYFNLSSISIPHRSSTPSAR